MQNSKQLTPQQFCRKRNNVLADHKPKRRKR